MEQDQVLLSMQQKLDNLCEQMNSLQDDSIKQNGKFSSENDWFAADRKPDSEEAKLCGGKRRVPEWNPASGIIPLCRNLSHKPKDINEIESGKDEMLKTPTVITEEQEERRLSETSFCWSVTSSVDIQLSSMAAEQEFYKLRKECEEKDATIKELSAAAHACSVADSKRITELEEIMRRKSLVTSKLKKDMAVLEKQVIELTRLRRASCAASNSERRQLPVMANNLLYDMSSSSPSSSDSDSPIEHKELHFLCSLANDSQQEGFAAIGSPMQPSTKSFASLNRSTGRLLKQRSVSPPKENRMIQRAESTVMPGMRQLVSSSVDSKRMRRHTLQGSKNISVPQKRWI